VRKIKSGANGAVRKEDREEEDVDQLKIMMM